MARTNSFNNEGEIVKNANSQGIINLSENDCDGDKSFELIFPKVGLSVETTSYGIINASMIASERWTNVRGGLIKRDESKRVPSTIRFTPFCISASMGHCRLYRRNVSDGKKVYLSQEEVQAITKGNGIHGQKRKKAF